MSGGLRGGGLRRKRSCEDLSPMESVANLADVMLVFACGLMMALILNWNVDIGLVNVNVDTGREVSDVEDLEKQIEDVDGPDSKYLKMGMLYQDPITGKMYMISEKN